MRNIDGFKIGIHSIASDADALASPRMLIAVVSLHEKPLVDGGIGILTCLIRRYPEVELVSRKDGTAEGTMLIGMDTGSIHGWPVRAGSPTPAS